MRMAAAKSRPSPTQSGQSDFDSKDFLVHTYQNGNNEIVQLTNHQFDHAILG